MEVALQCFPQFCFWIYFCIFYKQSCCCARSTNTKPQKPQITIKLSLIGLIIFLYIHVLKLQTLESHAAVIMCPLVTGKNCSSVSLNLFEVIKLPDNYSLTLTGLHPETPHFKNPLKAEVKREFNVLRTLCWFSESESESIESVLAP